MTEPTTMLPTGWAAPDFTLPTGPDRTVGLNQLRGSPTVLVFYPADFSPVCTDQMSLYQAISRMFDQYGATVLGLSVDSVWCHRAFAEQHGIRYPLLADFEPKGEVARRYGVYDESEGVSERALYVLDEDNVVAWQYKSPRGVNPGANGILAALDTLKV